MRTFWFSLSKLGTNRGSGEGEVKGDIVKYYLIILVSIAILILPSVAGAQITFEKWYGGIEWDYGLSVVQTSDGGYIIAGMTYSYGAGLYDVYFIKTDVNGDTTWTRTYGGTDSEEGRSVIQILDAGYIITGGTESYGAGGRDAYVIKTDSLGDTLWTKTYGGINNDSGSSVALTSDGGYIVAGWTYSYGLGVCNVYLIKTDSLGDTLWTRTYGGTAEDWGRSVALTSDGGYIVAGVTCSYGAGGYDVYLIKTDSLGDTLWTRTYGGTDFDSGSSVALTSDGGYIIAGVTYSYGLGAGDVYLIKTDSLGDTLWTKTYGGINNDSGSSVALTSDGGYIIAGRTDSYGAGSDDAYLIKTDSNGDTIWTRLYGGTNSEYGSSVIQTSDSGFLMVGGTTSYGAGLEDVYLIKTDSLGVGILEKEREGVQSLRLVVSPNPFATFTNVNFLGRNKNRTAKLTIYDASGRLVKSIKLTTKTYQLGSDLVPGIYFLKLDGKPVGKVVKVR